MEPWEHPKPAEQRLGWVERLFAAGKLPEQPETRACVRAAAAV
ncbi:hypothetical protein [Rubrobacter xylanophilus]|nr:hypothetical protein [Rubrobacter xylanophilus]